MGIGAGDVAGGPRCPHPIVHRPTASPGRPHPRCAEPFCPHGGTEEGRKGCRDGGMQGWRDAGREGCREGEPFCPRPRSAGLAAAPRALPVAHHAKPRGRGVAGSGGMRFHLQRRGPLERDTGGGGGGRWEGVTGTAEAVAPLCARETALQAPRRTTSTPPARGRWGTSGTVLPASDTHPPDRRLVRPLRQSPGWPGSPPGASGCTMGRGGPRFQGAASPGRRPGPVGWPRRASVPLMCVCVCSRGGAPCRRRRAVPGDAAVGALLWSRHVCPRRGRRVAWGTQVILPTASLLRPVS